MYNYRLKRWLFLPDNTTFGTKTMTPLNFIIVATIVREIEKKNKRKKKGSPKKFA